jgi:hypothetical protein
MSEKTAMPSLEALEREKARILEEAKARLAELDKLAELATKYNFALTSNTEVAAAEQITAAPTASEVPAQPEKNERPIAVESIADLIARYKAHPNSAYAKLNYRTRLNYDSILRRVIEDCGHERLADLKAPDIQRFYEKWTERGHPMARSLVTMLRMLFGFGTTILADAGCERLSAIMHTMRFKMAKPRNKRLTAEQAIAVRAMAHKMRRPSIALAQAFQFALKLGQKDVIGEWLPIAEEGWAKEIYGDQKWLRGLCWDEIDQNWILRHKTSNGGKDIKADLKLAPIVMEELKIFAQLFVGLKSSEILTRDRLPRSGPIIRSDRTGRPYRDHQWRREWRIIARLCGIPDNVWNTDSRAGSSEGNDGAAHNETVQDLVPEQVRATEGATSVARH